MVRVEQNAHAEAIEFYAEGASMRENQAAPRVGRDVLVANERKVMAQARSVKSRYIRPVLVNGDTVVVRWVFEFTWLDGRATRMEEIAYQRWENDRIIEEQFFYDPSQLIAQDAKSPSGCVGLICETLALAHLSEQKGSNTRANAGLCTSYPAQMKGAALLRPPLLLTHFKETTALLLSESLP